MTIDIIYWRIGCVVRAYRIWYCYQNFIK